MMHNLTAIILAAGKGSRVGQPKWQLPYHDTTFLDTIAQNIIGAGIANIITVARPDSIPPSHSYYHIVINPHPEHGMFSSLYYGLAHAPPAGGYLIFPVDHPLVSVATLQALCYAFQKHPTCVIRPVFNNIPGHPIILSHAVAEQITSPHHPGGLKKFLQDHDFPYHDIPVLDPGVIKNINVLSDF